MEEIRSGQVVGFFLFDVGEQVDLAAIPALLDGRARPARLLLKPPAPAYVQYGTPPVDIDGDVLGTPTLHDYRVRVRVYDYGVVSVSLTRPFRGAWADLLALAPALLENQELEQRTEQVAKEALRRLAPAFRRPRATFLFEDYAVFVVHECARQTSAADLVERRGGDIASLLRVERQALSAQERESVLAHRISYLEEDLVVPAWNAAFVYDTPTGAAAALEILEFANSQLLDYRHYDQLLDREMAAIYADLQRPRLLDQWVGSRYARAARQVHTLFIDVTELTDRTENTIKFVGDLYAVRLFRLVGERLGLDTWRADVQSKLRTLDDIYRFAVEQTAMSRGHFLELIVVIILVLELGMILLGITR